MSAKKAPKAKISTEVAEKAPKVDMTRSATKVPSQAGDKPSAKERSALDAADPREEGDALDIVSSPIEVLGLVLPGLLLGDQADEVQVAVVGAHEGDGEDLPGLGGPALRRALGIGGPLHRRHG